MQSTNGSSPVRLKDIAALCGVSTATVSRALRDPDRHSKALTDKIRKATEKLGYDPDLHQGARRLSMQRHGKSAPNQMIAVILPPYFHRSAYFYEIFAGILDTLTPAGFGTLTLRCGINDPFPACLRRGEVDGAILTATEKQEIARLKSEPGFANRPLICISESVEETCCVAPDYAGGMEALTSALIKRGVRRFLYLHKDSTNAFDFGKHLEQQKGIRHAVKFSGNQSEATFQNVPVSDQLWDLSNQITHIQDSAELAERLAGSPTERFVTLAQELNMPTAILAPNDSLATLALLQLEQAGLSVPEEVMVTGFDGVNPHDRLLGPRSLTTLVSPLQACSRQAASQLLTHLNTSAGDYSPLPPEITLLPARIHWGDTTGR